MKYTKTTMTCDFCGNKIEGNDFVTIDVFIRHNYKSIMPTAIAPSNEEHEYHACKACYPLRLQDKVIAKLKGLFKHKKGYTNTEVTN